MEWFKISTKTELLRVATDEIVYMQADGNYCDIILTNGKSRKLTFQLHHLEDRCKDLHHNHFVRVGRSLIVNKRYVYVINLTEQRILFAGQAIKADIPPIKAPLNGLKELMEIIKYDKAPHDE